MAKKEEFIRDFNTHMIIGIIETADNGDKTARLFSTRMIVGYYIKRYDHTTDFYGRVLTKGDSVVSLIYSNLQK